MTRTTGSKNIKQFDIRSEIESTSSTDIKHLSGVSAQSALCEFQSLLRHQKNYIIWVESRHNELIKLKVAGGSRVPKDSTYKKLDCMRPTVPY